MVQVNTAYLLNECKTSMAQSNGRNVQFVDSVCLAMEAQYLLRIAQPQNLKLVGVPQKTTKQF